MHTQCFTDECACIDLYNDISMLTSHDVTVGKTPTVKCCEVIILIALLSVSSATFGQVLAELWLESSVDRTQLKR